jgi:hypothetical protein
MRAAPGGHSRGAAPPGPNPPHSQGSQAYCNARIGPGCEQGRVEGKRVTARAHLGKTCQRAISPEAPTPTQASGKTSMMRLPS